MPDEKTVIYAGRYAIGTSLARKDLRQAAGADVALKSAAPAADSAQSTGTGGPRPVTGAAAGQRITADRIVMQGRWPLQSAARMTVTAGAIQMTGRWPAALDRTVVASDAIRMTGRWPATAVSSQTVNAPPIQMTGRWPAALAATVITSSAVRMTGRWPAAFTPVTITTNAIRMTGRSSP